MWGKATSKMLHKKKKRSLFDSVKSNFVHDESVYPDKQLSAADSNTLSLHKKKTKSKDSGPVSLAISPFAGISACLHFNFEKFGAGGKF